MENCRWCCEMLAEALDPLVPLVKTKERIHVYDEAFNNTYMKIMRQKVTGYITFCQPQTSMLISQDIVK